MLPHWAGPFSTTARSPHRSVFHAVQRSSSSTGSVAVIASNSSVFAGADVVGVGTVVIDGALVVVGATSVVVVASSVDPTSVGSVIGVSVVEGAAVLGTGMVTTASVVADTSASAVSSLLPPMVTEQADNAMPATAAANRVVNCLIWLPPSPLRATAVNNLAEIFSSLPSWHEALSFGRMRK